MLIPGVPPARYNLMMRVLSFSFISGPSDHSKHCCEAMQKAVEYQCPEHGDRFDCPDCLIAYSSKFREYGLIVHDGGTSMHTIRFCPWCGTELPTSLRDQWFDELERLGIEPEDAPDEFRTGEWYRNRPVKSAAKIPGAPLDLS